MFVQLSGDLIVALAKTLLIDYPRKSEIQSVTYLDGIWLSAVSGEAFTFDHYSPETPDINTAAGRSAKRRRKAQH